MSVGRCLRVYSSALEKSRVRINELLFFPILIYEQLTEDLTREGERRQTKRKTATDAKKNMHHICRHTWSFLMQTEKINFFKASAHTDKKVQRGVYQM